MTDIVQRLRAAQRVGTNDGTGRAADVLCVDLMEAADEIERLRAYIAKHVGATRPATAAELAEKIESQGGGFEEHNLRVGGARRWVT